jgi:hypothetical protein
MTVVTPDGTTHCDDDGGRFAGNPAIRFDTPQLGAYQVWLTLKAPGTARAEVHVSEITRENAGSQ